MCLALWTRAPQIPDSDGAMVRHFDASGTPLGAEIAVTAKQTTVLLSWRSQTAAPYRGFAGPHGSR